MPGYIMHMSEANLIIDLLCPDADEAWKLRFIAGNLLPDTKKKRAKVTSHFWNPDTLEDMAIAPDLDRFLERYEDVLTDPIGLGYYAHLYLDERFVADYWPEMVAFYDDEGNAQVKKEKITKAKIMGSGQMVPRDIFFSGEYYYGDYSRMNAFFIDHYKVDLNIPVSQIKECPVDEVDPKDLKIVMEELHMITEREPIEGETRVFSKEGLCRFLERTARSFVKEVRERNLGYE